MHAPRSMRGTQQRAFDRFRAEYNDERPNHQQRDTTPRTRDRPSARSYPSILPAITNPSDVATKEVTSARTFRLGKRLYFLRNSLSRYPAGLEEVDDGLSSVFFCPLLRARIDARAGTLTRA